MKALCPHMSPFAGLLMQQLLACAHPQAARRHQPAHFMLLAKAAEGLLWSKHVKSSCETLRCHLCLQGRSQGCNDLPTQQTAAQHKWVVEAGCVRQKPACHVAPLAAILQGRQPAAATATTKHLLSALGGNRTPAWNTPATVLAGMQGNQVIALRHAVRMFAQQPPSPHAVRLSAERPPSKPCHPA
jgi:hypothetical protein